MAVWMLFTTSVYATSWVDLEPETVVNRADVIVKGTYDFSSEPEPSSYIFTGYEININAIYKGEIQQKLIAGIDPFDIGWAKEFQEDGGEFLLFLEEIDETDFYVPIAGPNGMITMNHEKVDHPVKEKEEFYNHYLNSHQSKKTIVKSTTSEVPAQQRVNPGLYLSGVAVFGMLVFWGVRRITSH
jgi:hypothetical protein